MANEKPSVTVLYQDHHHHTLPGGCLEFIVSVIFLLFFASILVGAPVWWMFGG